MTKIERFVVSVIIPYFQYEKGILTRSVSSALEQTGLNDVDLRIVIIDDTSPLSAEDELSREIKSLQNITILKQSNKGPAGARNTGLDHISKETRYVAFLDSDDQWEPFHLSHAVKALEADNDFYFSDLYQLGQTITGFNRAKRIRIDEHPLLFSDDAELHQYVGNMQEQIVTGNIIGTSTVVYRYAHLPALRFREDLVRAGEDYIFWLELTGSTQKIAFSSVAECTYGKGVNIYSGTKFGTPEYFELIYYETKYKKTILSEFKLSSEARNQIKASMKLLGLNSLRAILHELRKGKFVDMALFLKYVLLFPQFIVYVPSNFIKLFEEKRQKQAP